MSQTHVQHYMHAKNYYIKILLAHFNNNLIHVCTHVLATSVFNNHSSRRGMHTHRHIRKPYINQHLMHYVIILHTKIKKHNMYAHTYTRTLYILHILYAVMHAYQSYYV